MTTASPRIARDPHVPSTAVGLVVTAYLIILAVLIALSGWTVTRFGTRRVCVSAIAVFTVSSLSSCRSSSRTDSVGTR
ncbi:MAG: MFS transporter [Acidimicrobiales bacterium]